MLQLHRTAQEYGQRPSMIVGVRGNPWVAWMVDSATATFAAYVDGELAKVRNQLEAGWADAKNPPKAKNRLKTMRERVTARLDELLNPQPVTHATANAALIVDPI